MNTNIDLSPHKGPHLGEPEEAAPLAAAVELGGQLPDREVAAKWLLSLYIYYLLFVIII